MVELVKFARRLGKTSPLSDIIGASRCSLKMFKTHGLTRSLVSASEHNPGPEVQTDEELVAWIKEFTNSIARTSCVYNLELQLLMALPERYCRNVLDASAR